MTIMHLSSTLINIWGGKNTPWDCNQLDSCTSSAIQHWNMKELYKNIQHISTKSRTFTILPLTLWAFLLTTTPKSNYSSIGVFQNCEALKRKVKLVNYKLDMYSFSTLISIKGLWTYFLKKLIFNITFYKVGLLWRTALGTSILSNNLS